ncbi:MAG: PKD domain-containing protein [Taibaiella sp.]|nr:PKD domain-containing protein [Taibaiella sp.]
MTLYTRRLLLLFVLFFTASSAKALTAGFTADYVSGCSPLVVHFTNTSSGATSYFWDLGNGTTSTLTNVSGSYITAGTYTVILTAYNGSSSTTQTMTITVFPSPTVSFYASDTAFCPGGSTTFTSTSTPGVSGAVTYLWNFGDGANSTASSPTHTYTTPGYYNVTLILTNSAGCTTTLTLGSYIHVYTRSNVNFSSTTYFCHAPGVANFTNTTTGAGPFTYSWSFGDGNTSTMASPSNTYASTGTYTVKLVVVDVNGCTDSIVRTNYITVGSLTAAFTAVTTACVGTYVTFYNTSSTHLTSRWSFGDGGTSLIDSPVHRYNTPGTYSVRLIVYNGYCYDTVYHSIIILPPPSATFTYSPVLPCPAPATITFTGTVPGGSGVAWLYGDGTTGTGATSTHTYTSNARDTVSMIVVDVNGCIDTIVDYVEIIGMDLVIMPNVTSGCVPLTVAFNSALNGYMAGYPSFIYPSSITSYSWTFGDGGTSSSATPSHTYTAVGTYAAVLMVTTANGCTAYDTITIAVGDPPTVTFIVDTTHTCYHKTILFTATADSADTYFWNFGDGTSETDSVSTTTHVFAYPGTFTVTLIAYRNGCPSAPYTFPDSFIIDSPKAIIISEYGCSPFTQVQFYDSSMGADTHLWMFGDGTTSTLDNPSHNYPSTSTYVCSLATYNATSGCRDTATVPLNLIPPVLNMIADDTAICVGGVITFTPVVTGGTATEVYWDVNGVCLDPDTGDVFRDTFRVGGRYTIRLRIRDGHGCFDTLERTNWIVVGDPVDSFVASPPTGCSPLTVTFTDYTTDAAGLSIVNYRWAFGDGGTATVTTSPITHTYTAAGTYTVRSIVTDNIGCVDTSVRPALITVWKPNAVFTAGTTYPCVGSLVHFYNSSSGITGAYWLFGDGDTSTAISPDHVYNAVGAYTVKLIVYDSHGCTDTASFTNYINVTKPTASFFMSDSFSICPPLSVSFFNTSTAATSYSWTFGDGGTSVLTSPGNLYVSSGLYTVTLVAINSHGCRDTAYSRVNLYGYAGGFNYSPLTGCAPLLVNFSAALSNVPNIIWDFADGTTSLTSYSDTTSHVYTIPGAYVPKLILSDNSGCQNSSLGLDTIKVNAVRPGFTTVPYPVCVNTNINFKDTSYSYFSSVTSWHWQFNGGDTSNIPMPAYSYTAVGTYPVTLSVVDGWGCTGTITGSVVVNPPPTIYAGPDTVVCVGDSAMLHGYGGVSYVWTPPATLGCPTCQTTPATPGVPTTYTVTGTDANGCKSYDSVTVFLRTTTESRAWGDSEVCRLVPVQLYDTGGSKYKWTPSAGLDNPNIFNPVATPDTTTRYMVITRLGSCIPDTNYVMVVVHQLPTVDAGPDQTLLAGQPAYLQATGSLIYTLLWTPAITLDCDTCRNTTSTAVTTTTYRATVLSRFGCKASDDVTVNVYCNTEQIFIPNTFTPNGDGQNDVFYPRGAGVSKVLTFRIYNRWGELLFEQLNFDLNDVSKAWDGSFNGASARPDVYVYLLEATCATGEPLFLKGDVTIIR